ncbi:MAG: FAD:protein FMN transferase [Isosphaeraceae bacterium]
MVWTAWLGFWAAAIISSETVRIPPAEPTLRRFEAAETHMGSEFKLVLYCPDEATASRASRAAFDRIATLDSIFSDYQPESELMRLCDRAGGPPVRVSRDLFLILQRARTMFERSEGAFDVTVGPVVRLWRRARRDHRMPSPELLAKARSLVSMDFVSLDEHDQTVRLMKPGMKLDLGGIAKGYASDAAIATLREHGVSRALVAGAGDIVTSGPPPGRAGWTVGIAPLDDPTKAPSLYLSLRDAAASTSGDAERYVEIEGKRYSHIVDPKTGLGVISRSSVTVVARDGTSTDALATAVYCSGPERGLALVEKTPGAAAYILLASEAGRIVYESKRFTNLPRALPKEQSEPTIHLRPQ